MSLPEHLVVRPASVADEDALCAVLYDTFEHTWLPNVTPAAAEAFRRENRPGAYVAQRGPEFWVAERNGEVVGLIDWEEDFVNALHVRLRHARTGVGAALLAMAESAIARRGFAAARLETDTFNAISQRFYAGRGYVEVDRYPDLEWDSGLTTVLLVKSLR